MDLMYFVYLSQYQIIQTFNYESTYINLTNYQHLINIMSAGFQYDNFVNSEISPREQYSPYKSTSIPSISYGNGSFNQNQTRKNLSTEAGSRGRLSLKQNIDQLLGLCRQENTGIKNQFNKVIGAERQIVDILKEELELEREQQQYGYPNDIYSRSNVQMFPSNPQISSPTAGYGPGYASQNYRQQQRKNQSYPVAGSNYRNFQQQPNAPQRRQAPYSYGFNQQYPNHRYPEVRHGQYGQSTQNQYQGPDVYDPGYGSTGNGYGNQNLNIIKSKVRQVRPQNGPTFGLGYQSGQYDDAQVQQLQQQVNRLKNVVQNYESKLGSMTNNVDSKQIENLMNKLKQQGQWIRLNTIQLLKNQPSSPRAQAQPVNFGQGQGYSQGQGYNSGNGYGSGQQYGRQEYGSTQYGRPREKQSYGLNAGFGSGIARQMQEQLKMLRMECEDLHQENAYIQDKKRRY